MALSSQAPAALPLQLNKVAGGQSSWTSVLTSRHDLVNVDAGLNFAPRLAMAGAGTAPCTGRTRAPVEQIEKNKGRLRSQLLAMRRIYCHGSAYVTPTNNAYGLANVAQGVTAASGPNVAGCTTTQGNGRVQMSAAPFPGEEKMYRRRRAPYNKLTRDEQAKNLGLTRQEFEKKQKDRFARTLGYLDHKSRKRAQYKYAQHKRAQDKKNTTDTQPARPLYPAVSRKMPDEHTAQAVWRDGYNVRAADLPAGTKRLIPTSHAIACAQPPPHWKPCLYSPSMT
ncbi:hypothetical protein [Pseudomonas sp. TH31]|uniref:hypothetical protein n=1 Tax=Pseudomonas sp. TH31 TaxID=2796396 RepID=UPI0019133C6D|nr:hypothetical protein [Pseudomonas sp. TH31]MBK5418463.1 hypothetical protein [Pseudomonas sp. TH31]